MEYLKQTNKQQKIIPVACFSLLIHFAVAALIVFGLSSNSSSRPKLTGIDMVWISHDVKRQNNGVAMQKVHLAQPSSVVERAITKPENIDKPIPKAETVLSSAAAKTIKELANNATLAKYDTGNTGVGDKAHNINGGNIKQPAGDTSNANTLVAYPLYKENTPPSYPQIARTRGYEGIVLVSAEVLPNGRVGKTQIKKSSGYAILDMSAIEAVKQWKFEPARKSGNPFTVGVELPIRFSLHTENS